jgi:outer membrane protein assembly factor BamA
VKRSTSVFLWCVVTALSAIAAEAQQTGSAPPTAAAPSASQSKDEQTPPADPGEDVFDLWRKLRHKSGPTQLAATWDYHERMVSLVPAFSYKPSTGFAFGASASVASYRGDPADTSISSSSVSGSFSTKKQVSLTARLNVFTNRNRWVLQGDNRFLWTSQDTFGLGMETQPSDAVNTKFDHFRVSETLYRALISGLYAGVGFHFNTHRNVVPGTDADAAWDESPYVKYSRQNGLDESVQTSIGIGVGLLLDTRNNAINADRGWMVSASYRPFLKTLSGDTVWQEGVVDLRTYQPLTRDRRHKLAVWLYGDFTGGGAVPYFDLPATAGDAYGRSARGYVEGRFRGNQLAYGELEYRGALMRNGLLGMVAFLNATTVSDRETGQQLFDNVAPGGGIGLRVKFNKRSNTNICIDYGWGRQGSRGLYMALQEAF